MKSILWSVILLVLFPCVSHSQQYSWRPAGFIRIRDWRGVVTQYGTLTAEHTPVISRAISEPSQNGWDEIRIYRNTNAPNGVARMARYLPSAGDTVYGIDYSGRHKRGTVKRVGDHVTTKAVRQIFGSRWASEVPHIKNAVHVDFGSVNGESGSPLYNQNGEVCGILSRASSRDTLYIGCTTKSIQALCNHCNGAFCPVPRPPRREPQTDPSPQPTQPQSQSRRLTDQDIRRIADVIMKEMDINPEKFRGPQGKPGNLSNMNDQQLEEFSRRITPHVVDNLPPIKVWTNYRKLDGSVGLDREVYPYPGPIRINPLRPDNR